MADKKPFQVYSPNGAREDDYYWLRDDTRKNPAMLAYLAAENRYADARLARLKPLEAALFAETVSHVKQDDSTVPYRKNGWWGSVRRNAPAGKEGGVGRRYASSAQARQPVPLFQFVA